MTQTVLYKLAAPQPASPVVETATNDFSFILWKPSLGKRIPPGKGKKYFFYWLFHYLRVFKNRDYSAVLVYDGKVLASSLLVVPAYYKWPFMAGDDVQLTYVLTRSEYRGKGLAEQAVRLALRNNQRPGRAIWYVTNTENVASIRLCEKVGFGFAGYGSKSGFSLNKVE